MNTSDVPLTPPNYDWVWALAWLALILAIEGFCVFMAKVGGPWLGAHPWFQ